MKLYSIKLRLAGNVANEIRKMQVTAPEITVLRAVHGSDAVSDIKQIGEDKKRTSAQERERLYAAYANPQTNSPEQVSKKTTMLRGLFGHDALPLPTELGEDTPMVEPAAIPAQERAPAFAE